MGVSVPHGARPPLTVALSNVRFRFSLQPGVPWATLVHHRLSTSVTDLLSASRPKARELHHNATSNQRTTWPPQVDPGLFRELHQLLNTLAPGKGRLDIINLAVMNEGASADEFSLAASTTGPSAFAPATSYQPFEGSEGPASTSG